MQHQKQGVIHPTTTIAAVEAVRVSKAAHQLYQAGGKTVLPEMVQQTLQRVATQRPMMATTANGLAKTASREIGKGVGRAAGTGLLLDGAFAAVEAIRKYKSGDMTRNKAIIHVAKESATGAIASGAAVAATAALITLTGPLSWIAIMGVSSVTATATKSLFR